MTRAGRISVSVGIALAAGVAAQLLLNAALGHRPPSGSAIIFLAYLFGGLPGLLLDPILLLIEGVTFAISYNLLPKPPGGT